MNLVVTALVKSDEFPSAVIKICGEVFKYVALMDFIIYDKALRSLLCFESLIIDCTQVQILFNLRSSGAGYSHFKREL
jgi:hypothetical protein